MKSIKYINKIFLALGIVATMSCTDGFEELNQDPNSFNDGPAENVFAGVVRNTLDAMDGDMADQIWWVYGNYYGSKGGQFGHYFWTQSGLDGFWRKFYVNILKNTQEIIDNYGDDPAYKNRVYIAKIWKSYVYSTMVSLWGGVPMSEALGYGTTADYDSEEEIYNAVLNTLKEAAAGIDPAGDKFDKDPVFNGDNTKWIKFANSLRLKIALRISAGFPQMAEMHGSEVMANESGLVSSNLENMFLQWGTEQENWSFNYFRYVFSELGQITYPSVNFHFLLNLRTYNDPRLEAMVEPTTAPFTIVDTLLASGSTTDSVIVSYQVPYLGNTAGGRPLDAWNLNGNDNPMVGFPTNNFSRPKLDIFYVQDAKFYMITFAEMNFMKAEAKLKGWGGSKSAEEYYYAGIDASFVQYKVSGADAYKEQDGIKWGTESTGLKDLYSIVTSGISADPMDKIVRQRWIASFGQGHDAYCLTKRTRLVPIIANFAPDGSVNADWVELPERMIYPPSEGGINTEAYNAAGTALGRDELTSPLQMNKPYTPIDWNALPAQYSQEFASKWFGNSEDDLIANGIPYEILN
jgi:hypothetical protein